MIPELRQEKIPTLKIHDWKNTFSFIRVKNNVFIYLQQQKKSRNLNYELHRINEVRLGPIVTSKIQEPTSKVDVGFCFELAYVTAYAYNYIVVCRPIYEVRAVAALQNNEDFQLKYRLNNLRIYEYADEAYGIFGYTQNSKIIKHLNRE